MCVLMSESFIHSFNDSFKRLIRSETSRLVIVMNGPLNRLTHSSNETPLCVARRHNSSAVALIATIFVGEIEEKVNICLYKYNYQ